MKSDQLRRKLMVLLLMAAAGGLVSGCANVKPWQRGELADYIMRSDRDTLSDKWEDHIYTSREQSTGGRGVGGGGCGCN